MKIIRGVLVAFALAGAVTPALAATTVRVVEGGEGGGPMTLSVDQPTIKAGDTVFIGT